MARVSMSDVWDDTRAFVRRETALLVPLALATLGLAAVILNLAVPARDPAQLVRGATLAAMLPVVVLVIVGQLAIARLAVVPGTSVAEALAGAVRRTPGALLASLVTGVAMMALLLVAGIVAQAIGAGLGSGQPQAAAMMLAIASPGLLWLFVRLLPLLPLLAELPPTVRVIPPIRRALAMTKGRSARLGGAVLAFFVGYLLILTAIELAGGSIIMLAARAAGAVRLGETVTVVAVALIGAALQMVWAVFQSRLYLRLERAG